MIFKQVKRPLLGAMIACLFFQCSIAQQAVITRYFDSTWRPVPKESAFYFTEMVKEDTAYQCTSYWMKSKKLYCKSTYGDTAFGKPIGLLQRFYENGLTEDSSYYHENGVIKNTYHYYPDGQLWVHYTYNLKTLKDVTEAFDTKGQPIPDFIYMKEASFQEGAADWQSFLAENVKSKVPVKNGAPLGTYQVIVQFIVDKAGKISDITALTSMGYGMEEEVIRVMKKSPKWNPAILMGKTVSAYRRQPLTFIVEKG